MKWNSTKPVTMDVASTFPVKPTESGTLRILTVNGEEILVSFWASDTVLVLKKRLQELLMDGSSELPCSAMRLIFGTDVLLDNWILGDHGVVDGHQLTLVLSPAPIGLFRNSAPSAASGLGLSASVCASFAQDGSFEITIDETMFSADAFEPPMCFQHSYHGTVAAEVDCFQMTITEHRWSGPVPPDGRHRSIDGVLTGEFCEDGSELKLHLPVSGRLGLKEDDFTWITLFREPIDEENIHSEDKEDSDPFEDGSLWEQEYKGTIQMEGSQFQLLVTESTRNGQFHGLEPPEVLLGEKCEESGHVKLQLPFGGCSDAEEPPLIWLTLREVDSVLGESDPTNQAANVSRPNIVATTVAVGGRAPGAGVRGGGDLGDEGFGRRQGEAEGLATELCGI
ncbi:unnamed protein product [Durusdinium trenchii]|uniref:Ubiquitin-like domain-containing protein n=1 Tax=Durusdinium trenchii TaxID=1381693 RepID=A0ABP0P1V0_9DINO